MASLVSPLPQFQWRMSQPGMWEREADECEKFYTLSARKGKGCFPVTGSASFRIDRTSPSTTDDVEAALRRSWATLRYRHPTLGSRIEYDDREGRWKRLYPAFQGEAEANGWVRSTFKVIDEPEGGSLEWFNDAVPPCETPSIFLLKPKGGGCLCRTLFMRCPHSMTDGVGIVQLLDQLFEQAALALREGPEYTVPKWGTEHDRLSPSLRVAASIPDSLPEAQSKRFETIQSRNAELYQQCGILSLPSSAAAGPHGQGKIQRLAVPVHRVAAAQLLQKCKAVAPGVSVTHVFTAALALALAQMQPRREEAYPVHYVGQGMINLRPFCGDPYSSPDHAAAAYHTISAQALAIQLVVPASADTKATKYGPGELQRIAAEVRDFYVDTRPVLAAGPHEQVLFAPMVFQAFTPPPGSDPHAAGEPPFCPVSLSSIGNLGQLLTQRRGPLELTTVWAASEPIGPGVALFLSTWDGELELSAVFDTQYHAAEYMERFLKTILTCVCEGLRIDRHTP